MAFTGAALLLVAAFGPLTQRPARASSKQAQLAGATVFRDKGCEHCHGADGTGTDRGPDLSSVGRDWKKPHIEEQIRSGGGGMPAFGDVLQPDEIRSLVDYLSAKRKSRKGAKPAPRAKPSQDDSGN